MRLLKRLVRWTAILFSLVVVAAIIFAIGFNVRCSGALPAFQPINDPIPSEFSAAEEDIADYRRPEESTYLTFPEWYLVFNPQEYGQFIGQDRPSQFAYFASIRQFWGGYCDVYGIGKRNYPFNWGDHLMEAVIGTSFSVEYAIKGAWEKTIGRVSEWFSSGEQTEEDVYAAQVAQNYGEFILTRPWYEFPYGNKFSGLWKETEFFGRHFMRKGERKIFLSLEYGAKALYASLIQLATHAVYGVADAEVYASIQDVEESAFEDFRIRKIKELGDRSYIIALPHYQGFTDAVPVLVRQGAKFVDIAGNDEILLTAVAPRTWQYDLTDGLLLFEMRLMTTSERKRIAVQVPVRSLSVILGRLEKADVTLEHLYDY